MLFQLLAMLLLRTGMSLNEKFSDTEKSVTSEDQTELKN